MTTTRIGIIGAGAAGTAAARTLAQSHVDLTIDLINHTGQRPYNRTLVNKAVALGLITPEQATLPDTGAEVTNDTASAIDPRNRQVRFRSGTERTFDALIVTTGSRPRGLEPAAYPGLDEAVASGRLTTLHSLHDACRVRDHLTATPHPVRVLILGGGLVAAETASLLHEAGHNVVLIARSPSPGGSAFGMQIASRITELHRTYISACLGRTPQAIRTRPDRITVELEDSTRVDGDLAIVAHGTIPTAPSPWDDGTGIPVDDRLRHRSDPGQRIYAAGGVALNNHPTLGPYRIDHWDDAAAQGAHAARTLLHDLGIASDPGPYLPRSPYTARVYGHTITGLGHAGLTATERTVSTEPLLIIREHGSTPIAAIGLDAGLLIRDWAGRILTTPLSVASTTTSDRPSPPGVDARCGR